VKDPPCHVLNSKRGLSLRSHAKLFLPHTTTHPSFSWIIFQLAPRSSKLISITAATRSVMAQASPAAMLLTAMLNGNTPFEVCRIPQLARARQITNMCGRGLNRYSQAASPPTSTQCYFMPMISLERARYDILPSARF
jgi:hypothetical protein